MPFVDSAKILSASMVRYNKVIEGTANDGRRVGAPNGVGRYVFGGMRV
jgi:hypothetical protein